MLDVYSKRVKTKNVSRTSEKTGVNLLHNKSQVRMLSTVVKTAFDMAATLQIVLCFWRIHLTQLFVSLTKVMSRSIHSRSDLPCECLLWTPRHYCLPLRCGLSCATSGSTWDLSQRGSWTWSAPDRKLQSPTLYHKATLSAWISPGETWREKKGVKRAII